MSRNSAKYFPVSEQMINGKRWVFEGGILGASLFGGGGGGMNRFLAPSSSSSPFYSLPDRQNIPPFPRLLRAVIKGDSAKKSGQKSPKI